MSRRRAGVSPSLFPFLAVLICTLGTLILMLALVAQQANDAAVAQVQQEREQKLAAATLAAPVTPSTAQSKESTLTAATAERLIGEANFRVGELVSYRDQQTGDLERKRDEIAHIEAHTRRIREKLKELSTEVDTATSDGKTPDDAIAENEKTLVAMREEASKLRAEIAELETSERGSKPRVVIVPHRGPNGTQRRPVYVLCTAEGLQILPEGARITKAEALAAAEADDPNSNPLGAALRVARLHAMQQYGDHVPPYPLLIVRPDGIYMYRVASALMKDWDDQYGYELVPGEVDLAFPGGDNTLRREMDMAIQQTVARNYAFARGPGGGGGRGSGSGSASGESFATQSSPQMNQFVTSGSGGSDSGATGGNTTSGGGGSASTPARALPTLSARDLDRQAQSNGFSLARDQRFGASGSTYPGPPSNRSTSYGAAGGVQTQSEALNDFLQGKTPPGLEAGSGSDGGGSGDSETNGSDRSAGGSSDFAGPGATVGSTDGGGTADGTVASGSTRAGQNAAGPDSSGQSAPNSSVSSSDPNSMNSIAMTLRDSGAPSAAGPSSGSPSDAAPSDAMPPDAMPPDAMPDAAAQTQSAQVAQKMVRREGKNWALPDAFRGMNGTEFVRPISMRCHHDRYEIIERGRVVETFPFGQEGVYQPTLRLATSIRDRVMHWGATMQGGYWKPQLEVSVGPHAEQRFHELQTLMHNSGVDVVRRVP